MLVALPWSPRDEVVALQSSEGAFVALREDGTLIAWGHPNLGGCILVLLLFFGAFGANFLDANAFLQ